MKFRIYVTERTEFNHEVVIETPEGVENIDNILDKIEGKRHINRIDDFKAELDSYGCKVVEFVEDGSGDGEIEITDVVDEDEYNELL